MTGGWKAKNMVKVVPRVLSGYDAATGTTTTGHSVPPLYSRLLEEPLLCSLQIQSPRQHL